MLLKTLLGTYSFLRDHHFPYIVWEFLLKVPKRSEACSTVIRSRAFSVSAPVLWSSIPIEIWQVITIYYTFKKQLKAFLFWQASPVESLPWASPYFLIHLLLFFVRFLSHLYYIVCIVLRHISKVINNQQQMYNIYKPPA